MKWIKIMCNILDHPKIKMIRQEPDGDLLLLLWILMIIEAGKCEQRGYLKISKNIPYTDKTISMMTGIPLSTVRHGLNLFTSYGMIEQKNGAFLIRNWGNYQSEDKLASRRKNDRDRQRKYRQGVCNQVKTKDKKKVSRDSHVSMSRDVTPENRQEKNRIDKKTTTDRVLSLLAETPFVKISNKELEALEKRHGLECLLQAADIAAETWRRNPEERHNPGGYLNTLCSSLVVPEWYVPFSERKKAANRSPHRKKVVEAKKASLVAQEKAEQVAAEKVWNAMTDEQRKHYLEKARDSMPAGTNPSRTVLEIVARVIARKSVLSSHHD
jgi:predicted phage replisome organizer